LGGVSVLMDSVGKTTLCFASTLVDSSVWGVDFSVLLYIWCLYARRHVCVCLGLFKLWRGGDKLCPSICFCSFIWLWINIVTSITAILIVDHIYMYINFVVYFFFLYDTIIFFKNKVKVGLVWVFVNSFGLRCVCRRLYSLNTHDIFVDPTRQD
jgi:hypothetical protein